MLKTLFNYDISHYLKHKELKLKMAKELSINEEIIKIIDEGFKKTDKKIENNKLIEKAEEFIKFYPRKDEDNYVLKFIDCYKALSEKNFKEEEINTNNITLWDNCIKILLKKLLIIINNDGNISETSERTKLDEDKTIEKLNIFYSILFKFNIREEIKQFSFIPNEKGLYKELKFIYCNTDIDDEIKEILSILNEEKNFDDILIHHKIQLNIPHSNKKLEDIALVVDREIKTKYNKIDLMIQNSEEENVKINENFKKACNLLIQKWFKEHRDKIKLFEFTKSHLVDISVKILFDKKSKEILESLLIQDPETLIEMLKFQDPNAPLFWLDESFISEAIDESSVSSINSTLDNSAFQNQQNNFNFLINNFIQNNNNNNIRINNNNNNNNNNNYHYNNNRRNYNRNYGNNNYINVVRNRYNEGIRKYCIAQAFVYEKLLESHIFVEIGWKNQINENEEGELVILPNSHRYKVKKEVSTYDFIVKTNQNKEYKICVKRGDSSRNSYLKFSFNYSQWNLLHNEQQSIVFAFVSLNNENNPEIYFEKNINLSEL